MAKNDGLLIFCANTIQENEKMLKESCLENKVNTKRKKDFERLFVKLNCIRQTTLDKEESQSNSSWYNKNVTNYTYGPIARFPSGSWWGIRMDCSRDRIHDPFNQDIQNGPFGVTSICTSSTNLNEDVDFGNSLTITGEKYFDGKLDTDPLIKNYKNQIPVRLIRSYNLLNEYAPKTGYRYDGLYVVTNFWIGTNSDCSKCYKFALSRLSDQEPAPWSSVSNNLELSFYSTSDLVNNLKNIASKMYEFKKYSHTSETVTQRGLCAENSNHGLSQCPNENKKGSEKGKITPESSIVTRHVSKKANVTSDVSNVSNVSNVSEHTSENVSLTRIGNQGSKTHNTNISIRTGLYDSSHSMQHDNKKNTSLQSFCRPTKPLNTLKGNQHAENWNLSIKENQKNSDGKVCQIKVASNDCAKRVNYALSLNRSKTEDRNDNSNSPNLNSFHRHDHSGITYKKEIRNDSNYKNNNNVNLSDTTTTTTNMLSMSNCMYKNEVSEHKDSKAPKTLKELKSFDSLDSLTPDKILHLINNKDYPLSKLLIGNMIGLTMEQSLALQAEQAIEAESEDKVATTATASKRNFEIASKSNDLSGSRCYKFRRRRILSSRKGTNKSEMTVKYSKMYKEKLIAGSVSSLAKNISKDTQFVREPIRLRHSRSNVENERKERIHMPMNTSLKKHVNKKQRREITNLLIDAKIGPKIRGPRCRRLRCINNTYTKQSHRVVKSKKSKSVKLSKSKLNLKRKEIDRNVSKETSDKGSKFSESSTKSIENKDDITFIKSKKRKSEQTIYGDTKRRNIYEKELSKPCKTDAITQCSLIKEPLRTTKFTQNAVRNEQHIFIKIEYGDLKDAKSDIREATTSSDSMNKKSPPSSNFKNTNVSLNDSIFNKKRMQNKCSGERVSAFVPVNIPGDDLKIARLRSIGFKPIDFNSNNNEDIDRGDRKVNERHVAEKYDKYTNEENDIVVYMDDELQYQDIENEDKNLLSLKQRVSGLKGRSIETGLLEQEVESPWHGWKKIVTNKGTYWIGW